MGSPLAVMVMVMTITLFLLTSSAMSAKVSVSDLRVIVEKDKTHERSNTPFSFDDVSKKASTPTPTIPFFEGDVLQISFALVSSSSSESGSSGSSGPQQVFLSFSHPALQNALVLVASPSSSSSSMLYSLTVPSSAFKGFPGEYATSLIIGDTAVEPLQWQFGTLKLEAPAYHKEPGMYDVLPEIAHIFRKPEAQPPFVISLAFSGVVFGLLALLPIAWGIVGGNVKNFPGGSAFLSAVIFHGSLGLLLGVIVYGWFFWNTFQILGAAAIISVVTVVTGRGTLSYVAKSKK